MIWHSDASCTASQHPHSTCVRWPRLSRALDWVVIELESVPAPSKVRRAVLRGIKRGLELQIAHDLRGVR